MGDLRAEVAVPLPIDRTLTYLIPSELAQSIEVGMRVVVAVKSKMVTGFVMELRRDGPKPRGLKVIHEIVDDRPVVTPELMDLAAWVSQYYIAPIGEVLAAMSPPQAKFRRVYRLTRAPGDLEMEIMRVTQPERARIVEALSGRPVGAETLRRKIGSRKIAEHLEALEKEGYIGHRVVARKRRKSGSLAPRETSSYRDRSADPRVELTDHQRQAFEGISSAAADRCFKTFLLLGVTGSGKTEVYLRCIEEVLRQGRRAIYLVPEIALTPQIMDRVGRRLGSRCALIHSRLSDSERHSTWQDIISGKVDVVVGARSAVFAPLENLGLIVVDEEHDASYKQQDSPRYNAREVAIVRAKRLDAVVILGSATPTLESYHNAMDGRYGFYELPERISGGNLPDVSVVDMRTIQGTAPISTEAASSISEALNKAEQVLLFLNRRGFSNYIQCRDCGLVPRCRNCNVSLTYHSGSRALRCHYCGYVEKGWEVCPKCEGSNIEYMGAGTQRIEDYIVTQFPDTSCARFDRDSTRRKGSTSELLSDFGSGMVRLLVGTQMVAKGHDFKRVGLVVVVNADVTMNLPDFRSGERTFQILTQVAGRAGRGEIPGRVIIQTLTPDHHSLAYVASHDFKGFCLEEVDMRRELRYPPFARLVRIVVESRREMRARDAAQDLAAIASRLRGDFKGRLDIIGPSRAPISRVKNVYRWHLVLKGDRNRNLSPFIRRGLDQIAARKLGDGARFSVDVDPQVMM